MRRRLIWYVIDLLEPESDMTSVLFLKVSFFETDLGRIFVDTLADLNLIMCVGFCDRKFALYFIFLIV